ncbi:MAG TPA: SDR family oxidoreductase [Gemmatimonadales bacterium]|nr:SDR family oxidoreductase [Gemmatimonadales bacterium]
MPADNTLPPATNQLTGKRVVVTGGSSGIGRAIALAAAAAGADVALTYRQNESGASDTAAAIRTLGRRSLLVQADIANDADLPRLVDTVRDAFGGADAWINNAGADILTGAGARLSRREKLDLLLRVDLRGTMHASWAAAELLRAQPNGGVIINMSWDRVLQGMEGENPELFAAVKGGVLSFSRALARSLAPTVRVNVLGPGWIETAFGAEAQSAFKQRIAQQIPLGRWGTPEDVAGAAVYLASDAARYLTGQMIMVNGGDVV